MSNITNDQFRALAKQHVKGDPTLQETHNFVKPGTPRFYEVYFVYTEHGLRSRVKVCTFGSATESDKRAWELYDIMEQEIENAVSRS